jgi:phosphatidylglycerophosphatase C
MEMTNNLALFDFDGTITKKDSLIEWIKFSRGLKSFYFGLILLSPILVLFKAGIIKNSLAKQLVFMYFFRKESYPAFRDRCREFSLYRVPELIKSKAMEVLNDHIKNNDRVIIVTATFEDLLVDWCDSMHIELIGTKLVISNGLVTGKIDGENCYGAEKVKRLNQYLDISKFSEIYAYGDSHGDLPLLELANHRFYRTL